MRHGCNRVLCLRSFFFARSCSDPRSRALQIKIVELEARAEAAEMKLKTAQVGMRKAQQELEEFQNNAKKVEERVTQAEARAGDSERKGRNLLKVRRMSMSSPSLGCVLFVDCVG